MADEVMGQRMSDVASRRARLRSLLKHRNILRQVYVLSEILAPPVVALRSTRRSGQGRPWPIRRGGTT